MLVLRLRGKMDTSEREASQGKTGTKQAAVSPTDVRPGWDIYLSRGLEDATRTGGPQRMPLLPA